jgi:hypothetical protein
MRLPEAVRMSDDGGQPIWARSRKRRGNPIVGLLGGILALIAIVVLVLAGLNGGFGKGGAKIDGWIGSVMSALPGGKAKPAMDSATPTEPASAPASSQPAPAPSSAPAASSTAPAAKP